MAKKNFKGLLQSTRESVKKLRDHVHQLKREQQKIKADALHQTEKPERPAPPKKMERVLIEFSPSSVAKATLVVMGLFLLMQFFYQIREILILLFVSLFLAAALDSIVDSLGRKHIPRAVSVLFIYFLFFLILIVLISTMIPLVATQTLELAKTIGVLISNLTQSETLWQLPYTDRLRETVEGLLSSIDQTTIISNLQTALEQVGKQLQNIAGNTLGAVKVLFNGIFNAIIVMVMTFFLINDEKGVEKFLISLFPSKHGQYILEKSKAVKENIGFWLRGQLKLMVLIGVVTFIGLTILDVEYALTLSLIAGITELIPVVGPMIAMIPALLIGLNDSGSQALWIFLFYLILQQAEGNILVPIIMNKAVGLNPLVIVVSMMIGYTFMGVIGVIIAVPMATAISIFIKDYTARSK